MTQGIIIIVDGYEIAQIVTIIPKMYMKLIADPTKYLANMISIVSQSLINTLIILPPGTTSKNRSIVCISLLMVVSYKNFEDEAANK